MSIVLKQTVANKVCETVANIPYLSTDVPQVPSPDSTLARPFP